jgi:hypothetical protein
MPNPMNRAGYGKSKKDAENYTKPTIDREEYYDELTNDPRKTRGQMTPDQYKAFIDDKRKITAGMKPISRATADLNAAGGAKASGPGAAYTKSWIAKGEKASKAMQAKAALKGKKLVKMGNVTTYEGSLYQKRQQAFLKKMQEMNKRNAPKN